MIKTKDSLHILSFPWCPNLVQTLWDPVKMEAGPDTQKLHTEESW